MACSLAILNTTLFRLGTQTSQRNLIITSYCTVCSMLLESSILLPQHLCQEMQAWIIIWPFPCPGLPHTKTIRGPSGAAGGSARRAGGSARRTAGSPPSPAVLLQLPAVLFCVIVQRVATRLHHLRPLLVRG